MAALISVVATSQLQSHQDSMGQFGHYSEKMPSIHLAHQSWTLDLHNSMTRLLL